MCSLTGKVEKNTSKYHYNLEPLYIMNAKIKMRHYVTFIKPRNFDAADIKCFTVYVLPLRNRLLHVICTMHSHNLNVFRYSRLSLSRSRRDPLKHFEISVLRHIRFAELKKIPTEEPNFTNEHVI